MGYGFGSLDSTPYLRTYEEALKRFNNTKPIRGTENTDKPERRLGARRYGHLLIDKLDNGDVQCILYRTPVLTYKPNGDIVINVGDYTSHFTCAFIESILPGVSGRHVRGRMVLNVNGNEYAVAKNQPIVIRMNEQTHRPEVAAAEGVYTWRINRAKANNVRAPFKAFLKFYRGFVSLNSAFVTDNSPYNDDSDDPFATKQLVTVSRPLLKEVLGTRVVMEDKLNFRAGLGTVTKATVECEYMDTDNWIALASKPIWADMPEANAHQTKQIVRWNEHRDYLCNLMRSQDASDHLKAALIVLVIESGATQFQFREGAMVRESSLSMARSQAEEAAGKLITKMFAEQVLEYVRMPVGYIPKQDYTRWLFNGQMLEIMKQCGQA